MARVARRRSITTAIAAGAVGVSLLPGCSGGGGGSSATVASTTATDSSAVPRRNVDGRLKIGVWLPTSGPAAMLGTSLRTAIDLAVREINEAGGVNGEFVQVAPTRDEGSDPATAFQALRTLLDADQVDVIVGPASSRVALGALETLAEAQVVTCSPTSAARDLDDRRDDGYFVRTMGSEAFEAVALTRAMIDTGRQSFAVLYPEDDYGQAYATEMQRAFRRRREDIRLVSYDTTQSQFNGPVSEALAEGVEAVAVVGNRVVGPRVLAALANNDAPPQEFPTFVTSGLRTDDLGMLIDPSRPTAARGIKGVSPLAHPADKAFEEAIAMASPNASTAYAAYAYDCVNLLALAAQAAESDDAEQIQPEITAVSAGGSGCRRFSLCAELLAQGRSINLNGASGDLDLQDDGDVGVAFYDVFEYDRQGVDVSTEVITVRDEIA